jgi:iron complex outermembrane receptor protein
MVYGYYARGFKSGGFNGSVTRRQNIGPYNPEYVDSFEVGLKSEWLDRRLQVNLAGFWNNWSDMQVVQFTFADPTTLNSVILNAAEATTKGIELQVQAVPITGLHLAGTVGYVDATFDHFRSSPNPLCPPAPAPQPLGCAIDFSGRALPYAPHWTGSLSATYDFNLLGGNAEASLQYTYTDSKWGNYTQSISESLPSVSLLNANVSWSPPSGDWTIAFWSRNLLDHTYIASALDVPPLFSEAVLGNPREWGVDLKFKF